MKLWLRISFLLLLVALLPTLSASGMNIGLRIALWDEESPVSAPEIASKTYCGGLLNADVPESADYTIAENTGGTNVGVYSVTLVLADVQNTYWEDGASSARTLSWSIHPKALFDGMVASVGDQTFTGKVVTPEPKVTDAELHVLLTRGVDYELDWSNNVSPGGAQVTIVGKGNYTGSVTRTFTIRTTEESKLHEALDDLPATIEPDGNGGWKVTITNDIDAADLPIEIPDNLGNVTIDLGGHDLVGGDGEPAIRIVPGEGEGEPTQITIVNSGSDATVQGGEGAPAIIADDNARSGTVVNIGDGVIVQGGGGGIPAIVAEVGDDSGTIAKATYDMSAARWDYAGAFEYDGAVKTVEVVGLPPGVTVASYSGNAATEPGTYTAHVVFGYDATNYNEPVMADLTWSINPNEGSKLKEVFGGIPATVEPDGNGGWKVTLTDDVNGVGLPIELPDNLGSVVLDLNGHSIVSSDGGPAIRIVPGNGEGPATRLVIVDSSGGEKGQVSGSGESAGVEVGKGAASGVSVAVENGVAVFNGDGSRQSQEDGTVPFDANGGSDSPADNAETGDAAEGALPTPVLWNAIVGIVSVGAASSFDGFLSDAAGNAAGTVLVKVAKPKNGAAKATVTIQPVGGRKAVVNGKLDVATGKVSGIDLTLGSNGMSGTWNGYAISGSRNLFASKNKAEQGAANGVLNAWKGAVNVAWEGAKGWNGLSVSIAAKGKAKVTGALADGTKVTASGQLVVGEEWCCVPVVAAKAKLAFMLWLPMAQGAAPMVAGLGTGAVVGKAGSLVPGAAFRIDAEAAASAFGGAMAEYLPNGVAVAQKGAKWTVAGGAKAGKITAKNGVVDDSKAGANPSALKLTYAAKTGTFKGSFKVYAVANGKLKATTVNVAGVMIGGKGYGAATVKKHGGVPVTVE